MSASRSAPARRFSRTFLVTGALTLLGILLVALGGSFATAMGILLLVFASPVFAVSAVRHLLRGLLWRVGSRLFVSYLLVGVLPLPFLFGLVLLALAALSGQLGARRAVEAFSARAATLERTARDLANGAPAAELVALARRDLPALSVAVTPAGGKAEVTGEPPLEVLASSAAAPEGVVPSTLTVVARSGERRLLVTIVRMARGRAIATLPLDAAVGEALTREIGIPVRFSHSVAEKSEKGTTIHLGGKDRAKAPAARPAAPPAEGSGLFGTAWVSWFAPVPCDDVDGVTNAPTPDERTLLVVRTSIGGELKRLFAGAKLSSEEGSDTGALVLLGVKVLSGFVLLVYLGAGAISALLVLRIARATRRLSLGMAAVERGDFSYRARLKGRDQLAALVHGFNEMAGHLEVSVAERAQREALGHELEVARALQRRLLPRPDFTFPGLEIAADFRPAAAIGGDFYHLLPESDTRLSVVIADVSGHGLPTGIVMASAKASLSALASTGMDAPVLLAHLDEEIRQSTESRTFVTLAHVRFDLAARTAAYTNAGHLYPWVVRARGTVATIPNPARPLGLGLPATFRTVVAPLETGDLWVLVSDGIVEARSPAGEEFGFERLEALLAEGAGGTAAALKERILGAWRAHTGNDEPEDDRTLLVLRVL